MRTLKRALDILLTDGPRVLLSRTSHKLRRLIDPAMRELAGWATTWDTVSFRDKWADTATISGKSDPVIVDAGAAIETEDSVGAFIENFEDPEIIAFEPRAAKAKEIIDRYPGGAVRVEQLAVGDEPGAIELNLSGGSSSVLEPSSSHISVRSRQKVQQVRLDEFLDVNPDILKLDLQGYELQALEGAAGLLDDVEVIITEVNFQTLYDGSNEFHQIDRYLQERGLQIFNLYDIHTWQSGDLVWADAVYLRESG